MKRVLSVLSYLFVIFLFAGCAQQNQRASNLPPSAGQKNEFPEIMVGIWEAEINKAIKWDIKFEPDGSIKKIVHSMVGPVNLSDGGIYLEGPEPDTYAVFVMGPCKAKYDRKRDELEVKIVLDHYEMKMPNGILQGRIEDYIRGPISKDGKSWAANWVSYGWLEGADPPDPNVIEANPEKLVFTKIDVNDVNNVNDVNGINDINGVE